MNIATTTPFRVSGAHTAERKPALNIQRPDACCPGAIESSSTDTGPVAAFVDETSSERLDT
jgi:hypothetical protein